MSAAILQMMYSRSIHLLTSRTKGVFSIRYPLPEFFFHTNLLLVEAEGIAPSSCPNVELYQQTVTVFIPCCDLIVKG